jgi:hypothetical protein
MGKFMKMQRWMFFLVLGMTAGVAGAERTAPATFYVDSAKGNDAAEGTAETSAWQSLEKVNKVALIPGDQVLFRRGGLWRGQLFPQSGSNGTRIVYGAYGAGEKPILQGSVARSRPEEWSEVKPGLWATQAFEPKLLDRLTDLADSRWSPSFQEQAKGTLTRVQEDGHTFTRVTCKTAADKRHLIQIWGPQIKGLEPCLVLRLRVRSTLPFKMDTVEAMLNHQPYTRALCGTAGKTELVPSWQTVDVLLLEQQKMESAYLHFNLGGMIPAGAVFDFEPLGIWRASVGHCTPLTHDVGILIFNHGARWGVKKWALEDLKAPLDYWYDKEGKRLFVACEANPASKFTSVELALTQHIINEGKRNDITYDGLAVRYGAAHGFGGGSTQRITIRNCDVYWIGGGLQYWKKTKDGKSEYPVRYGNGIEFWGNCTDNLVERNRLWQIYDAALTNQGMDDEETSVTYRDNVIWQAEYSFEYWNAKSTANILFEHNTCVDAGYCWSHNQRPNPNGAHLMFYNNRAATTNFVVRNNLFVRSSDRCTRMWNDWRSGLTLQNNLYWSPDKPIMRWMEKTDYLADDFAKYQSSLGLDANSIVAEPQFVDAAARDYRLKPGTPGTALATNGGPVGARFDLSKDGQ